MNDTLNRLIDVCWMVADSQTSNRCDESVAEMKPNPEYALLSDLLEESEHIAQRHGLEVE